LFRLYLIISVYAQITKLITVLTIRDKPICNWCCKVW